MSNEKCIWTFSGPGGTRSVECACDNQPLARHLAMMKRWEHEPPDSITGPYYGTRWRGDGLSLVSIVKAKGRKA